MKFLDRLLHRKQAPAPTPKTRARPSGPTRAYINDALAEMDRIYAAKGAEAACLFIRVALVECPKATAKEVERAVAGFKESCQHEWVTTTNIKFIPSGWLCGKCGQPKTTPGKF